MEEKIRNDGVALLRSRSPEPLEHICHNQFGSPSQFFESAQGFGRHDLFLIHQKGRGAAPMGPQAFGYSQQECGVAGAEFNQSLGWRMRKGRAQRVCHDLGIAHPGV